MGVFVNIMIYSAMQLEINPRIRTCSTMMLEPVPGQKSARSATLARGAAKFVQYFYPMRVNSKRWSKVETIFN